MSILNQLTATNAAPPMRILVEYLFPLYPRAHGVSTTYFSLVAQLITQLTHAINSRSIISDITALICIIFAGSCCCCSIVFLSAEHSRLKEGLTFREAYLIPIPLVAAEIDSGDKDYLFPPDQPTAIARAQTSIDIPVAEPTEHSSLVGHHHADRSTLWQ